MRAPRKRPALLRVQTGFVGGQKNGFYHGPAQLDAWCRGPGPHLGHYGNGRVYHLPHSGRGRPDGGRQPWHGRRGVCAAGAERLPGVGGHGGRRGCGHAGGHGHGPVAHRVRHSAHFGGHFDTAGAVFGEPARDGLWHGRRQGEPACQRGQIRPFGQRALCARGGALEPHFCAGAGGGHCDRADVLVFWHRERLFAARHGRKRGHGPGPGYQHQLFQGVGADDIERPCGARARCLRSTRAFPTSTWAVAPSSLALRPLSSAR